MKITNKQFVQHLKKNLSSYHLYEIQEILNEITLSLEELVINGNEVRIDNFGTFKPLTRKAHIAIRPDINEHYEIDAMRNMRFTPLKSLNQRIKKAYNDSINQQTKEQDETDLAIP